MMKMLERIRPDNLIHLAAFSGNLNFNQKYPSQTFENNVRIGINVFSDWANYSQNKALNVIPSCAYPDKDILYENMLWDGKCHKTIESHGLVRRCVEAYTRQLNKEGSKIITAIVNNSSGEGDSFDLEKTKVVGAMIKRFCDAVFNNDKKVTLWGDGNVTREFIYSKDVAKCLIKLMEDYEDYLEPINITSGQVIKINDLAYLIKDLTGFTGSVEWDITKPNGQNQKSLSMCKMNKNIDIKFTPIEEWLTNTINWYRENYLKGTEC